MSHIADIKICYLVSPIVDTINTESVPPIADTKRHKKAPSIADINAGR